MFNHALCCCSHPVEGLGEPWEISGPHFQVSGLVWTGVKHNTRVAINYLFTLQFSCKGFPLYTKEALQFV